MAWLSSVESYSYGSNIEDFVVKIHHGGFLYYFSFTSVSSKKDQKATFTRYTLLEHKNLNFSLRACRIFSCVMFFCYYYYYYYLLLLLI